MAPFPGFTASSKGPAARVGLVKLLAGVFDIGRLAPPLGELKFAL